VKRLGIPVVLDRPRSLLLDAYALRLLRERFGIREDEILKLPVFGLEIVQQLLWCGLQKDDRRLTYEKNLRVGDVPELRRV
jgi:hypothetical protein